MQKFKSLIFYFSFIISNINLCDAQFAVVKGEVDSSHFSELSIFKYSAIEPEQNFENYPSQNGKFEVKILLDNPQVSRIYNNYFLLNPGDTLQLNIKGEHIPIVSTTNAFNKKFLNVQKELDSLKANFWEKNQYSFNSLNYLISIQDMQQDFLNILTAYKINNTSNEMIKDKAIERYLKCYSLFLYSMPFCTDTIDAIKKDSVFKYVFLKFIEYSKLGYNTRNEFFDIAINNCFIKGFYEQTKSFAAVTKLPEWGEMNDTLKRIIAVSFIKSLAENDITLSKQDLMLIKQILCNEESTTIDNFCEYYHLKIDYSQLVLNDVFKTDYFTNQNGKKTNAASFFKDKDIYIDLWASWCAPCIEFIKELDMKKLTAPDVPKIIFVSIDEDLNAWHEKSLGLNIPDSVNYLLNNGLNSNLAKTLSINHIPYIIHIKNNRIDILNASKSQFTSLLKEK